MSYKCAFWGELDSDRTSHMNCAVIVDKHNSGVVHSMRNEPAPRICKCECRICKRAWEDAGRPLELELQMDLDRIYLELERFSREGLFSELEKLWGEVTKEIWYNIDHIRKL